MQIVPNSSISSSIVLRKKSATGYIIRISLTAALAGFIFGFDTVVISGANLPIKELWHTSPWFQIEIDSFEKDSIEVRDTSVKNGQGSVFHFDSKGKLGLYAFMIDWPVTNFMILYDSNGRKQRMQENEVVQWRYREPKKDSILNLTVLLCAVDRNYGNLTLSSGHYIDSSISLFETTYAKIIYFKSSVPFEKNSDSIKIYVRGEAMEKCTKERFPFIYSTTINLK